MSIKIQDNHPNYRILKFITNNTQSLAKQYHTAQFYKKHNKTNLAQHFMCPLKVSLVGSSYSYIYNLNQKYTFLREWMQKNKQQNFGKWKIIIKQIGIKIIKSIHYYRKQAQSYFSTLTLDNILINPQNLKLLVFPFAFSQSYDYHHPQYHQQEDYDDDLYSIFLIIDQLLTCQFYFKNRQKQQKYQANNIFVPEIIKKYLKGVLIENWSFQDIYEKEGILELQNAEIPQLVIPTCPEHNKPILKFNQQSLNLFCQQCIKWHYYDLQIEKLRVSQQLQTAIQKYLQIDHVYQIFENVLLGKIKISIYKFKEFKEQHKWAYQQMSKIYTQIDDEILKLCCNIQQLSHYEQKLEQIKIKGQEKKKIIINDLKIRLKSKIKDILFAQFLKQQ